jgi:transcriptional regulator with XRE-family HTH domain
MPRRRHYLTPVDEKLIGRRLRELRKRRGLTQTEVGKQLGVDQTVVSNYERGAARVHGALIAGFAKILRVSADEILGLKEGTPKAPRNGRLIRRLERVEELSAADQRSVLRYLDALVERQRRRADKPRS